MQIVRHDRTMEQIVFPIPEMCEYLTRDTQVRVFNSAERDEQGSKVADFFQRVDDMFHEMTWQKKLRGTFDFQEPFGWNTLLECRAGQPVLFWVSSHMSLWSQILFNVAVIMNLIVALFYPFSNQLPSTGRNHFHLAALFVSRLVRLTFLLP